VILTLTDRTQFIFSALDTLNDVIF
jgi:hypothetical protein